MTLKETVRIEDPNGTKVFCSPSFTLSVSRAASQDSHLSSFRAALSPFHFKKSWIFWVPNKSCHRCHVVSFEVTTGHLKAAVKASRVPCILPTALPAPPQLACSRQAAFPGTAFPARHGCSEMLFQHEDHPSVSYLVWQSFLSLPVPTVPMAFGPSQPLYRCSAAWVQAGVGGCLPALPCLLQPCLCSSPGHQPGPRHPPFFTLASLKSAGLLHFIKSITRSDGHLSLAFGFAF